MEILTTDTGMKITEKTIAIWNGPALYWDGDVVLMLTQTDPANGFFQTNLRFRRFIDDKVWNSEDQKEFFTLKGPKTPSLEKAMDVSRRTIKLFCVPEDINETVKIGKSMDQFLELLSQTPGFYVKTLTPEEAKEMGLNDEYH